MRRDIPLFLSLSISFLFLTTVFFSNLFCEIIHFYNKQHYSLLKINSPGADTTYTRHFRFQISQNILNPLRI